MKTKKLKNKILIIYLLTLILSLPIIKTTTFAYNENTLENSTSALTENATNTTTTANTHTNLYSKSAILIECSTKKIAYEHNADTILYPASTTKLLTAIITVENCPLTDTITITQDMLKNIPSGYTTAYLKPGEQITINELLNVLLIPSANDAGFALAIHISGSIQDFSNLMNQKAKQIGCTNSNFTNPSGIHDPNHYSTASDMAKIGLYALEKPHIQNICSQTSYTLNPGRPNERIFNTTNTLMKKGENTYYQYATGLKTGFTAPAGSCIIATAQKDNMKFLAVILGAPEPQNNTNYRDLDCQALFEYGFQNYESLTKVNPPQPTPISISKIIPGLPLNTILKITLPILTILIILLMLTTLTSKKTTHKNKKSKK